MAYWKGVKDETGPLESGREETRLEGTEWRCLSFGTQCLGISTAHWLPAALPTPTLLSIHSTLATFLFYRDQRDLILANNEQEHLLYTKALCPSSPESSGWTKMLAFVYMWCLPEIIFLWLSGVSGRKKAGTSFWFSCCSFCTDSNMKTKKKNTDSLWWFKMGNVPLRLWYLKPSSPVGGTIWRDVGSCRLVGGSALLEVGCELSHFWFVSSVFAIKDSYFSASYSCCLSVASGIVPCCDGWTYR